MAVYEYKTEIRYNDINEKNEMSDKGLINILSEAAGAHSEQVGYGLNTIEETNCAWMLLSWKLKIYERPCWNTELTVKTWAREFSRVSSWRDFEVFDKNGTKIAIATTEWVLIDAQKMSLKRLTEEMENEYGIYPKNVFEEEFTGKIKEAENMNVVYEYTASRRDIDVNHHVNNVIYLELAYDAFPKDISPDFSNLEIYYKKQIKIGEKVKVLYGKEENAHTVSIRSIDEKTLHAVLKFF